MNFKSFCAGDGIKVFEPEGFNPVNHLPSPAFVRDLCPVPDSSWNSDTIPATSPVPKFKRHFGKSIAIIETCDADLYGGGEVNGHLRRSGKQQFWNTNNPGCMVKKGRVMYQSQPFIMGVRTDGSTFGIIAETSWKTELSIKEGNNSKRLKFISDGPVFRIVVIEKPTPQELVMTLTELTGKMELPPLWALGYQQCRYSYFPQQQAAAVADSMRSHRIPCDVIWMDIDYMDGYKVFTYHPEGYGDPRALNEHLHALNFKAVYMIDPGVKAERGYAVDDEGMRNDYYLRKKSGKIFTGKVWPGLCHFPDFTREDVSKWWAGLYKDFMSTGVDGIWNDMNEPSVISSLKGYLPSDIMHKGGVDGTAPGPHLRYRNVYGHYMVKASREGMLAANPDKRPFLLTRSAFLGTQRYAATWTGDNFSDYLSMKESVPMVLNMGLSGQAFSGPDIGGFLKNCSPELLRHWTCSGIYFPFARNHTSKETINQEPWAFDQKTLDICRSAIERRYRLLPYYYTVFEEASRTGLPVMRPVFWADVKDLNLRGEDQAYMIGSDLLVVPRWSQSPCLPKGSWARFTLESEDDGYQAFLALRPGAVIPIAQLCQSTAEYSPRELTLLANIGPDGKAEGHLYIDDGDGFEYRNGRFARYDIKVNSENGQATVSLKQTEGKMEDIAIKVNLVVLDADNSLTFNDSDFVRLDDYSVNSKVTLLYLLKS